MPYLEINYQNKIPKVFESHCYFFFTFFPFLVGLIFSLALS